MILIAQRSRCYKVYGLSLRSDIPFNLPEDEDSAATDVTLFAAPASWFAETRASLPTCDSDPYAYLACPDGSDYLRWTDLFEFVVSPDGRSIACGLLEQATVEVLQTYLLGQVLSFALVKQGDEPLHATAIVVDGRAVVFLADCGGGKSTLAAEFVHGGHEVLTDDLLLIREVDGVLSGFAGPPRIKLFPRIAAQLLPGAARSMPMHPSTEKLVIPLERHQHHAGPVPIDRFLVLDDSGRQAPDVRVEPFSGSESFVQLVRAAFNVRLVDAARLHRQFQAAEVWHSRIPVHRLAYPRTLEALGYVRNAVLADVRAGRTA